jgi:hypothetical protein
MLNHSGLFMMFFKRFFKNMDGLDGAETQKSTNLPCSELVEREKLRDLLIIKEAVLLMLLDALSFETILCCLVSHANH